MLTIYDLPGCDFPIKASFSTLFVNAIVALLIVPVLVVSEVSSAQYIFYGTVAVTFVKVINMPLMVSLTMNYNRKCNRRDRQKCNARAGEYYQRRANQDQLGVSHIYRLDLKVQLNLVLVNCC